MEGKFLSVKDIDCYKTAFELSNIIWRIVNKWTYFEQNTIGKQFVRSIDSIPANIAEGFGRYNKKDKIRFYQISKGSLLESIDWLEKAKVRDLISNEDYYLVIVKIELLPKQINQLIKYTNLHLKI